MESAYNSAYKIENLLNSEEKVIAICVNFASSAPNGTNINTNNGYYSLLGTAYNGQQVQIHSDTDWSGTYGDATGSTTIDGHGNKDITFSCSNTYSAFFHKKGEEQGFLTLNIVQPVSHIVKEKVNRSQTINGVPIEPGKSVSVSKRITDLADFIEFFINQVTNSSSTAKDTYRPFNSTTLRETITDPNDG